MNFLPPVPIQAETIGKTHIHGFYKSAEGRAFMRHLFSRFLDAVGYKEYKVASIILNQSPYGQATKDQTNLLKKALMRWHQEKQSELWSGDLDKTLIFMKLLEAEMMACEEIAAVLTDQAATSEKVQAGSAFAGYFYGFQNQIDQRKEIGKLLSDLEGLYVSYDPDMDLVFAEMNKAQHASSEDTKPPEALGQENYYYFRKVAGQNFLLAHVFALKSKPQSSGFVIYDKRSGFCYPMKDGSLYAVLYGHSFTSPRRSFELFENNQESHLRLYFKMMEISPLKTWYLFSQNFMPLDGQYQTSNTFPDGSSAYARELAWKKDASAESKRIANFLEKSVWDIVL